MTVPALDATAFNKPDPDAGPAALARRPVLFAQEVAVLLRLSYGNFIKQRPELEKRGFPRPSFTLRYSTKAVLAWIDRQVEPPAPANDDAELGADAAAADAELQRRLDAMDPGSEAGAGSKGDGHD